MNKWENGVETAVTIFTGITGTCTQVKQISPMLLTQKSFLM
jgi:hypothetical protein